MWISNSAFNTDVKQKFPTHACAVFRENGSLCVFELNIKNHGWGNVLDGTSDTCVFSIRHFIRSEGVVGVFSPDRPVRQRGPARVSAPHKCPANWVLMGNRALIFCQHGRRPKRKRGCLSFSNDAPCAADNSDKTGQRCSISKPGHAIPVGNRI